MRYEKYNTDLFAIRKSKLPKAGYGVFAKQDIPKGQKLGEYIGKKWTIEQAERLPFEKRTYLFEIKKHNNLISHYLDAMDHSVANWTRFINGAKTKAQRKAINVSFYQYARRIWIKSIKNIKKGDELIVDYGDSYWTVH